MSRVYSYINSAKQILAQYKGRQSFTSFLKKYFAANKRFGSTDRKQVSHLCYCYFRVGKAMMNAPVEERILAGLFLCSNEANEILESLKPEWNAEIELHIVEKCSMLAEQFSIFNVFPWPNELSANIDQEPFCYSHFNQPDLFLRARPGMKQVVEDKLRQQSISFTEPLDGCIALSNTTRIDSIIELNKEAVVQDLNSQRVGELFNLVRPGKPGQLKVWDCCAGSGGKSILAKDILGDIDLTVTDIRKSILANLEVRFKEAGITGYRSFVADLSAPVPGLKKKYFDLVIADLPCTGSGTWSRTPEQLYYFKEESIEKFAELQQKIIQNVVPHIKPGGFLLYITCSVFKKENEETVEKICKQHSMELVEMKWFMGYDKKADTLFGALLKKPHPKPLSKGEGL